MVRAVLLSVCLTGLARAGTSDPLVMNDGTRVTTARQWSARRGEMKAILEKYLLGVAPPPPGNVRGQVIKSQMVLNGAAKFELVRLSFGLEGKLGFEAAIYLPAK